jgi:hypothetical protein
MARGDLVDLPRPALADDAETVAWEMLVARFHWYHRKAMESRLGYLAARIGQSILAATITVAGVTGAPSWLPAVCGAAILLIESVQQLMQLHTSYVSYRVAAETLRTEAWLFATPAGEYGAAAGRGQRLAERVGLISLQENSDWASAMRQAGAARQPAPAPGTDQVTRR